MTFQKKVVRRGEGKWRGKVDKEFSSIYEPTNYFIASLKSIIL